MSESKVASNDFFLELINLADSKLIKKSLCDHIKDKGLTFSERDVLQNIIEKSLTDVGKKPECNHTVGYSICEKYLEPISKSDYDDPDYDWDSDEFVTEWCGHCPDCGDKLKWN
jgi:hypothetical protein